MGHTLQLATDTAAISPPHSKQFKGENLLSTLAGEDNQQGVTSSCQAAL